MISSLAPPDRTNSSSRFSRPPARLNPYNICGRRSSTEVDGWAVERHLDDRARPSNLRDLRGRTLPAAQFHPPACARSLRRRGHRAGSLLQAGGSQSPADAHRARGGWDRLLNWVAYPLEFGSSKGAGSGFSSTSILQAHFSRFSGGWPRGELRRRICLPHNAGSACRVLIFPSSSCEAHQNFSTDFHNSFESHPSRKPFPSANLNPIVSTLPRPFEWLTSYYRQVLILVLPW